MTREECLRTSLKAEQQRSVNFWKCSVGRSPSLITYAMSLVSTNGTRSLHGVRVCVGGEGVRVCVGGGCEVCVWGGELLALAAATRSSV